ncbi:hypothetical protein H4219_000525 [Mycoemilia scoparia]|uniref:Uncharacterized protein n=1 Tax=Mycoemilia scoparia TaxID=417184 RepID=A0A9W8DRK7_9FUNG|nr:hypothetical protein H4219_000525 [Mycoemilia scoparia]
MVSIEHTHTNGEGQLTGLCVANQAHTTVYDGYTLSRLILIVRKNNGIRCLTRHTPSGGGSPCRASWAEAGSQPGPPWHNPWGHAWQNCLEAYSILHQLRPNVPLLPPLLIEALALINTATGQEDVEENYGTEAQRSIPHCVFGAGEEDDATGIGSGMGMKLWAEGHATSLGVEHTGGGPRASQHWWWQDCSGCEKRYGVLGTFATTRRGPTHPIPKPIKPGCLALYKNPYLFLFSIFTLHFAFQHHLFVPSLLDQSPVKHIKAHQKLSNRTKLNMSAQNFPSAERDYPYTIIGPLPHPEEED